MRHLLRDSIIWVIARLGFSFLRRRRLQSRGPLVRVLCFHDVRNRPWFESVLTLLRSRYHVLSPADFRAKRYNPDRINILLTFDDGYQSWVDVVLPTLEAHGARGLFFVNSGLLTVHGSEAEQAAYVKERLLVSPKDTLSSEGLKALVAAGHTIGGHTVHHYRASTLSEELFTTEVVADKASLESMTETSLGDFAYPFGTASDYSSATDTIVRSASYERVYIASSDFVRPDSDDGIPRTLVEKNQSLSSLSRWIEGGYDIFRSLYFV